MALEQSNSKGAAAQDIIASPGPSPSEELRVFWIGVSAQRNERGSRTPPLTSETPTGAIIDQIIAACTPELPHTKLNLVDRVLLDESGRLRPPTKDELAAAFRRMLRLMRQNRGALFIFLGNYIRDFFQSHEGKGKLNLYTVYDIGTARAAFVHHPSYVRVYKYKKMAEYTSKVASLVVSSAT